MKKARLDYFTKAEKILFLASLSLILTAFFIFDRENYLTLTASLIGIASLTFASKGNPLCQVLIIIFSLIYGYISYRFTYYGEMITYVGMTMPMAIFALVSWLRNPFQGNRAEVTVNRIRRGEIPLICLLTAAVTVLFYFILKYFGTANLLPSTISVTTSFAAVYLAFRRSAYYAVGYACNDIVLIILWALASLEDVSYISMTCCFLAFLANDIYAFVNWRRMERRQIDELLKKK